MQSSSFFSGPGFEPLGGTTEAQVVLRSIIDQRILDDENWGVSIVCRKQTEHAFLVVEGRHQGEPVQFRSDLFLNSRVGINTQRSGSAVGSVFDRLLGSSESSHGEGFVRVKQISLAECQTLAETSEYQSWPLTREEAERLLTSLEAWGNKTVRYHIAGNGSSYSPSTSTTKHHNCVSWCEKVLQEIDADKFTLGKGKWRPIKRPSDTVKAYQAEHAARPGQ